MKYLIILVSIFFISCSSKPPKWYNKIYTDNQNFIYTTGSGKTKQEAINQALINASSKISIIISSTYKSLKYSYKGNDTSSFSSTSVFNIETKTNPINFTDYKILKLEKKDKYYVLIKINRYKNAKFMCDNININSNYDNLDIFLNHKKLIKDINKKIEKLRNINALYPICKKKLKKALLLQTSLEKKIDTLTFDIKTNNNELKNLIESIIPFKKSKKPLITIYANEKKLYKQAGEYKITIIDITLEIKSFNKSKSFEIKCAGSSIQDYSTATLLAYKECKEKLKKIFNN